MGLIKWLKNTFYTSIFLGVIGASVVAEFNTCADAYRENLEKKIEVVEEYRNRKDIKEKIKKFLEKKYRNKEDIEELEKVINELFENEYNSLKEKYQKFKESSTYRILEMITHPYDTYKAYKEYGRKFDFGKLFTKDSLVGFGIGALGGFALRTYMAAHKLSRKRRK
ncbi:MAG: hypothetical protein QXO12_00020 [Candidatus Pacearchaeota archaeon]